MADLLFEIFSEEIPARMQLKAAEDFKKQIEEGLKAEGLGFEKVLTFVTPRRLTAVVSQLATHIQETTEERRGPRIGAPEAALTGFLNSNQIALEACSQRDGYWYATITHPAKQASEILPPLLRQALRQMPWAKTMRWPEAALPWVRPVRSLLCLFNEQPLVFDIPEWGLQTGNTTYGHRFLAPQSITVSGVKDYQEKLKQGYVILEHSERQKRIKEGLQHLAVQENCQWEEDQGLLEEVAGLTEYPYPLTGKINPEFMHLPKAVLSTSMRVHQKYFTFLNEKGTIAPYFGFAANIQPSDGGQLMRQGYERVLRARLSDAAFFYNHDKEILLETLVPKLDAIVFHAKLGSLGQRVERITSLMTTVEGKRAAMLAKADLVTMMVGEFPELQGIMGGIYAKYQGESEAVSQAIEQHYQPAGLQDNCPSSPIGQELALADKLDTLVGFFGIGEVPTGSKDPFGLRRAALGVIRIIREHTLKAYPLKEKIDQLYQLYQSQGITFKKDFETAQVVDFIIERLSYALKAEGIRHDCLTAVLATGADKNICSLADRAASVTQFVVTPAGEALQAAFRRAQGILVKSDVDISTHGLKEDALQEASEKKLYHHLEQLGGIIPTLMEKGQYLDVMQHLSELRPLVDDFFELKINADQEIDRLNRFSLLQKLIDQMLPIADFGVLEG